MDHPDKKNALPAQPGQDQGAEASLHQARISVDKAGDMILWADLKDARLVFANQAACDTLRYSRRELLGMTVLELNPTRTIESWRAHGEALRQRGRLTTETVLCRRDGSLFPVESTSSLVVQDGVEYSLGIIRDITERKGLEASLRQAQVGMDAMQDMIFWTRVADRAIAYVNRAACEAMGYTREELLGLDVREINPLRDKGNWRETCSHLRSVNQMRFESEYRRKDGSFIPVETHAAIIVHEGVEYAVGLVRDITERKAAEERLRAEIQLNSSLADAAKALIGPEPNLDGISGLILARARELTESEHGYVGLIDQQTANLHPGSMTPMMQGGDCEMKEARRVCPVGPEGSSPALWGHSLNTLKGFFDNDPASHASARGMPQGHVPLTRLLSAPALIKGRLVGQIALANSARDYTQADLAAVEALADVLALGAEQLFARRELLAAKEAAEASSHAKSEFLANMTHEVRTPLNGILGMTQVLLAAGLTEEQKEYARVVMDSAERLHLLLGNVLEYARLDSGQGQSECLDFPPTDLLHSLAAVYEPRAKAKGLDFSAEAGADLPELMRGDPQALRQALAQLLDNALKFTLTGGVRLFAAALPDQPGLLAFRVEDTGIGIPPDKREHVFEAFVQADASITRSFGGAGLGLAIARRQAERLGGDVRTAERPGGGTVMTLTVPAQCPPDATA